MKGFGEFPNLIPITTGMHLQSIKEKMQSFRTEIENPAVENDIIDLERKIRLFREGKIDDDKFRSLRLARGVYGQRQHGVQMIRIKLPYGKMTFRQWRRISDVSDKYSTGNLHLTTRQDIQIHFVSLDKSPELWAELEKDDVTLREACGNTVRNVTASVSAGVDPNEPFDITPYAHTTFEYFLRNPICQEMGRKFKVSFSNTDEDTALSYMHDLGFIPKIKDEKRGFKILIGGGLGAQPRLADIAYEFLPTEEVIPFMEAVLRVFDRHGERNSRNKARMKFLLEKIGFEEVMRLVEEEKLSLKSKVYPIEGTTDAEVFPTQISTQTVSESDQNHYDEWLNTNVVAQKQAGYHGVYVRVPLGNIGSETSRQLSDKLEGFVGDDVRVTINQSLFLRNVPTVNLPHVFNSLNAHYLAEAGANSLHKITSCPGTDTCNLAISDSTHVTVALESVLRDEFPELVNDSDIKIKISGCMNSCGQHGMAQIGFHGSSMRAKDRRVMPALQVLLGGGTIGNGEGRIADKVIKIPSKQGPEVLRHVLSDYEQNRTEGEYFNDYYDRREGKIYFYDLLKPLADIVDAPENFFVDWGQEGQFATEIGVGECAGVIIDLIGTLFLESDEKIELAKEAFAAEKWADAIYHAYSSQVNTAKALLLDRDVRCNTQHKVIADMDDVYAKEFGGNVQEQILAIRKNEPSKDFATDYIATAVEFLRKSREVRGSEVV